MIWVQNKACVQSQGSSLTLSGALQQGAKCTQDKLCAFMDQNLGYVFSLSIQNLQSKHPNILLAIHNSEVGLSALCYRHH